MAFEIMYRRDEELQFVSGAQGRLFFFLGQAFWLTSEQMEEREKILLLQKELMDFQEVLKDQEAH